ncbi:acylphosphatase [Brachybacterium alimentarium]|uniref:acylphosphatase n=1 Tax=Brachybacterium alimentarium TaxID=47845 RepID=UPI003FD44D3D
MTGPAPTAGDSADHGVLRRLVRVQGRVQGVGFRMAAASEAERLGVVGTVRNLWDGSVEADVEGSSDAVGAMLDWLREGPPGAQVSGTEVRPQAPKGAASFRVTG